MPIDRKIVDFARVYHAEIVEKSQPSGEDHAGTTSLADFKENIFTELLLEDLVGAGIIDDGQACFFSGRFGQGMAKVNGYGVSDDEDRVDLFITIFTGADEPIAIPADTIRTASDRAFRFLKYALQGSHSDMEPSSDAHAMASRVASLGNQLTSARVFVLVDGFSSTKELPQDRIGNLPVAYHIWDIERLFRSLGAGLPHATIEIDLVRETGTALRCLAVPGVAEDYVAYLCVVPAEVLFLLYEQYGSRLLELNVRSFLQARGKVNKGIRETIKDDPEHFFAFNNGLSLTASEVRLGQNADGLPQIEYIRGLQIVNGGQTTASIHRARKVDRFSIDHVFVQAKLTVVPDDRLEAMVPKISKFANSQNAVNEADFSANHPYHIELERLSNTVWVPGEQSRWFYERARGQYQVQKIREGPTPAQRKRFEDRVPASQKFTKTDLAKFINTWDSRPHLVSRGGQKNFIAFMDGLRRLGLNWVPDISYYKDLVAKAILFKETRRIVSESDIDAYRANVVTYTMALLVAETNGHLDLDAIWATQAVPEPIGRTLSQWAPKVYKAIIESAGSRNVTEWCKSEACWEAVRALNLKLPAELSRLVVSAAVGEGSGGDGAMTKDDIANIAACKRISAETWMEIFNRAIQERRLSYVQRNIVATMGGFASSGWQQAPSAKQAKQALAAWRKMTGID